MNRYLIAAALTIGILAEGKAADSDDHLSRLFGSQESWIREDPYEEPIETDRHDFTQSPKTVGRRVAQLEFGYLYLYNDADGEVEHTHVTPEMMFRYGLAENVEVRMRWNYAWRFIDIDDDKSGGEDLRVSLKLELTDACECVPATALEIRTSVPTGGSDWSTDGFEWGLDYIYEWELNDIFSIGGSTGFVTDGAGDVSLYDAEDGQTDSFVAWSQSLVLGAELSEQSTGYLEWFALFSDGLDDAFTQHYVNIGVDILITDNLVIDFRVGKGLTSGSEDLFAGVGGGFRF